MPEVLKLRHGPLSARKKLKTFAQVVILTYAELSDYIRKLRQSVLMPRTQIEFNFYEM